MDGSTDQDPGPGVSNADGRTGPEQNPTKYSKGPPKEGSNRGYEVDKHAKANVDDSISGRPPKSHSEHTDDGRTNKTRADDEEVRDPAQPT